MRNTPNNRKDFAAEITNTFREAMTRQISEGVRIRRCQDTILNTKSEWHQPSFWKVRSELVNENVEVFDMCYCWPNLHVKNNYYLFYVHYLVWENSIITFYTCKGFQQFITFIIYYLHSFLYSLKFSLFHYHCSKLLLFKPSIKFIILSVND